jgi:hypothetical protein
VTCTSTQCDAVPAGCSSTQPGCNTCP